MRVDQASLCLAPCAVSQTFRAEYTAWWTSKSAKWGTGTAAARRGPLSFRLASVAPSTAEPDTWLRYAFRLQLLETLTRVGSVPGRQESLKSADGRDIALNQVEELCRHLWAESLGAKTGSKSVELTAKTAAATAAGEVEGGGPATRFLVAAALCHDESAERLRAARQEAATCVRSMDLDGRRRQYEAQLADANARLAAKTQEAVLQITNTSNHRALAALRAALQREGRLMMIEDAEALSTAVGSMIKSISTTDDVKLAALAPRTDEAATEASNGDAVARGLDWGRRSNTMSHLLKRLRSLLERSGLHGDTEKRDTLVKQVQAVRHQISARAKANECTFGEAADQLSEELHPSKLPTLTPELSSLLRAVSTVAQADLAVPSLATQVSDVDVEGIEQWTDPAVLAQSVVAAEDVLLPVWASDGPPGLLGLQRRGRGTVVRGVELRGVGVVGSDDVSLLLAGMAATGAAGAAAAARRGALIDADPGYASKQLASLHSREMARAEVQAALDSRKLRNVAAVIEQARAKAAKDMDDARKRMLLQYHAAQELLSRTAEQVAMLQKELSGGGNVMLPRMPKPGANLAPMHTLGRGKRTRSTANSRTTGSDYDEDGDSDEDGVGKQDDDDDDDEFVDRRSRSASKRNKAT